jgi:mannose-1-phosphate guanylyltransferase
VKDNEMNHGATAWAVVLAGGEGSRLQALTRNSRGAAVPKQFCSLRGGPCLLEDALGRALAIAPHRRMCTIVASQHRHWWNGLFTDLPDGNLIVQPRNRGTAHGILLPLLHILARDPDAHVVILPADHYVRDERTLAISLRQVAELARANDRDIFLLGMEPEAPDTELGYILPGQRRFKNSPSQILQFVEKPSASRANALVAQGALWNAFIIAGSVWALLRLFGDSFASTIVAINNLIERKIGREGTTFDQLYESLPSLDFSQDVLQGHEAMLQVLPVPPCGWTDLGTPQRLGLTLQHLSGNLKAPHRYAEESSYPNLAHQYTLHQQVAS